MSQLGERFVKRPAALISDPSFSVKEVIVAGDLGPCGGVRQAIDTTQVVLGIVDGRQPVYANRQPVHNNLITQEFQNAGLIIQPDLQAYKKGDIVILSAHGTPPSEVNTLRQEGVLVVNTECQLVAKDRRAAERAVADGNTVLYVGVSNHPEPKAVTHDLPQDRVVFMDSSANPHDIALPTDKQVRVISQTTVSARGTRQTVEKLRELNPDASISDLIGICGATDFRQDALFELLDPSMGIEHLLILGSPASHNTTELTQIGKAKLGEAHATQIDQILDIDPTVFSAVTKLGFTAGASVLDRYSEEALQYFQQRGSRITFLTGKEKDSIFTAPRADIEAVRQHVQAKYAN